MSNVSQKRAARNYRRRLSTRGLARFEVLGLEADRDLIRKLARRLAANDREAAEIRASLATNVAEQQVARGGILDALRRSPLVGADIEFKRERGPSRKVNL